MTLDRFIHKLKCFFSETYRQQRREATEKLIDDLKDSRQKLITYIEQSLLLLEHYYNQDCKRHLPGDDPTYLNELEAKLLTHQHILKGIKEGKRIREIDIRELKQTLELLGVKNETTGTVSQS